MCEWLTLLSPWCTVACPVRLPQVSPVVVAGQLSKCTDQLTQSMQLAQQFGATHEQRRPGCF